MKWKLSLFEPDLTDADIHAAMAPLQRRWLTMGEETQRFENAFAEMIDVRHAIAVSSGTAALHLALMAHDIGPGDEILVPSLTFVACANVICQVGAEPVFVDVCSESDWTISPADIEAKITPKTKAVMAVHYAGMPCAMDTITELARKHTLAVIEDCAHALVSRYQERWCGGWGDVGCFSFFSNKNMTTGEGGMITTNDETLAQRIRNLRSHGMTSLTLDRYKGRATSYDVTTVGLNYRIDEIRAALGHSQLPRLHENLNKRRQLHALYVDRLKPCDGITIPFVDRPTDDIGVHIFPVALPESVERAAVIAAMKDAGIQTSIHYPLIHQFSGYEGRASVTPMTDALGPRLLTLPFYPAMTEDDVALVCDALTQAVHSPA